MSNIIRQKRFMEEMNYAIRKIIEEGPESVIEELIKNVFETVMKVEREMFLE